jgi:hypothetical protein
MNNPGQWVSWYQQPATPGTSFRTEPETNGTTEEKENNTQSKATTGLDGP